MLRAMNFVFALVLLHAIASDGQVRVAVSPGEHRPHQYMTGIIRNRGLQPVTVCFEPEEQQREDRQAQPFPFSVERLQQCEWMTVLTTSGKGSGYAQVIKPGENFGFPFTVEETGQYRLVLQYWLMDNPRAACPGPAGGNQGKWKTVQVKR